MGAHSGPDISESGLVLALDGANYKSFKGEATTNYYSTPETLTSGRTGSTDGTIKTDYTSGGPTGGRFTRVVRDTSVTRSTDWEWQIDYSNTGLSLTNPFVVSFYARCPNGTLGSIKLSNPDVEVQTFNIDSTWRRFTASFTYGAQGGLTFFRFNRSYSTFSSVNGATYDLANIQIEAKSYSTTFTTGTRGTTVATGGGWADLSGNGNHGELVNGVRESADNLGSLVFDGIDDYVNISNASALNPSYVSVSCWVRFNNNNTPRQLIAKRNTFDQGSYWLYVSESNVIMWDTYQNSIQNRQTYTFNFLPNVWYNISATYSSSQKIIYVNGNAVSSTSGGNQLTSVSNDIRIGADTSSLQYFLNGNISQVSIYNKALTASEIQQNFNATKSRYGL